MYSQLFHLLKALICKKNEIKYLSLLYSGKISKRMSYQLWQGIYVVNIEPGLRNFCKCGKTNDLDSVYKRYGILGKVKAHLQPVSDPDYAEALIFLLLFHFRKNP